MIYWLVASLVCSIVLGTIFDTKLGPSLRASQYERMQRVDDENDEMALQLAQVLLVNKRSES